MLAGQLVCWRPPAADSRRLTRAHSPPLFETHRSEQERFRRRDLLHALRNRREQIQSSLKRQQTASDRDSLLGGGGGASSSGAPRETEATAALDSRGLMQLQEQVMRQQDRELEQMEKTVSSTKVRAGGAGRRRAAGVAWWE